MKTIYINKELICAYEIERDILFIKNFKTENFTDENLECIISAYESRSFIGISYYNISANDVRK